jgi:hypothetical protein
MISDELVMFRQESYPLRKTDRTMTVSTSRHEIEFESAIYRLTAVTGILITIDQFCIIFGPLCVQCSSTWGSASHTAPDFWKLTFYRTHVSSHYLKPLGNLTKARQFKLTDQRANFLGEQRYVLARLRCSNCFPGQWAQISQSRAWGARVVVLAEDNSGEQHVRLYSPRTHSSAASNKLSMCW